ncbi:hypothetical protein FOCC_FOCC008909 [Frankliniella occidentalis]|uniref:Protein adenylyltransferase Fic n=1 Tax=Frankliniella occidentalis TaxID=133901 RepID=A0A6J1SV88_FRAOC|nr:protein adenylyltransferase Fic [Frankliniella occidentalis]KAE8744434.1 hypothetical protein FOCC_FOCC008909 [Frankliniella occidentalis]
MTRLTSLVVFFAGIACAIFIPFFSHYLGFHSESIWKTKFKQKAFTAIPDEDQIRVSEDIHLEVALRAASDVNVADINRNSAAEAEAEGSLHAALEMKRQGKLEKALKLFEHAYILAPLHTDILNHYGEFLEDTQKDIIMADQLYFQALTYSPGNTRALVNRQRTAHVVERMDLAVLQRIDRKRDEVSAIPDHAPGLRRAKKEAYFQHIYHTVGIEGNTMTLSQTRSILETRMAVGGKSLIEHNEILGLDAAMKFINSSLINRLGMITVEDILEIHRRVLGYVDPIEGGSFRRTQVYVGGHIPPHPSNIYSLMGEFILWLNSEQAARMHPVRYAALAHYKLVAIHPFSDGNGRTSRLLMNAILMQAGFPPVIILKQDRSHYYKHLEMANRGDVRPFVRFIAECTERTLDLFLWATSEYAQEFPALETIKDSSRTIFVDESSLKVDSSIYADVEASTCDASDCDNFD